MFGKSYFLLALLQAVVSEKWTANIQRDVTAQKGLCARIPCHYTYPSLLANEPRTGIWISDEKWKLQLVAFHSEDHSQELQKYRHRTRLSGDLKDGNCSLVIDNITQEDEGPYHFRIKFDHQDAFSYFPATQLHVSDFTDKPSIVPADMVAGKPGKLICTFNTMCNGTTPTLTWVTPTDVPPPVSSNVTQRGDTLIYTSVLTLTPELKHHGQTLTCRVRYPSVSSERTFTLTVKNAPQNLSITSPDNVDKSWVSVKEGDSAAILCSVQSFPASNLTWRRLGVTLNTSSSNELWLEVPRVTPQLAGVYQCVAKNEHGRVERNITLSVERQSLIVTPLTAAAVVVFLIIASAVIGLIVTTRQRTDRPPEDASRPASEEESTMVSWRTRQKQGKEQKYPETTSNVTQSQDNDIYVNCQPDENSIYANV